MSRNKKIFIILFDILLVAAFVIYFGMLRHPVTKAALKIDGVVLPEAQSAPHFQLTDHLGKPFTEENLKGRWTMVFFGFTNCGMVCPTTMAALNDMYQDLKKDLPDNKLPRIVMISVDPDRDSVKKMKDYVNSFNPDFIGARADITETVVLEKQLHIAAAKMQADGEGKNHYTINHTADVLLFNPNAQLQAFLAYPHQAKQMANDYKLILETYLKRPL